MVVLRALREEGEGLLGVGVEEQHEVLLKRLARDLPRFKAPDSGVLGCSATVPSRIRVESLAGSSSTASRLEQSPFSSLCLRS